MSSDAIKAWTHIFGGERGYLCLFSGYRPESNQLEDAESRYFMFPNQVEEAARYAAEKSAAGREAYFCAHLLHARRRVKGNAQAVVTLWCELDGAEVPNGQLKPTAVVNSDVTRTSDPQRALERTGTIVSRSSLNRDWPSTPETVSLNFTGERSFGGVDLSLAACDFASAADSLYLGELRRLTPLQLGGRLRIRGGPPTVYGRTRLGRRSRPYRRRLCLCHRRHRHSRRGTVVDVNLVVVGSTGYRVGATPVDHVVVAGFAEQLVVS